MKVKIEYSYSVANNFPFIATAEFNERWFTSASDLSFDDARVGLIAKIKKAIVASPTIIPEPEEVEI